MSYRIRNLEGHFQNIVCRHHLIHHSDLYQQILNLQEKHLVVLHVNQSRLEFEKYRLY